MLSTDNEWKTCCIGRVKYALHDDVIKWKHFPRYWPFVRGIHRSPVNSPLKGQWRGALLFSLICARINDWINNREAGDLRRHCVHYDVIVMQHLSLEDTSSLPSKGHILFVLSSFPTRYYIRAVSFTISKFAPMLFIWGNYIYISVCVFKRDTPNAWNTPLRGIAICS